jgi:hypothetical protein
LPSRRWSVRTCRYAGMLHETEQHPAAGVGGHCHHWVGLSRQRHLSQSYVFSSKV